MTKAEIVVPATEYLVPESHALAMIENCARQIEQAATIPQVKMVITQAEAIDAVMRKIKASDAARRAALVLMVEAERQLGRITKQIPQGKRGAGATPGQQTKRKVLHAHGLNHFRCAVAEKLAGTPQEKIDEAASMSKSPTVFGVAAALGFRSHFRPQPNRAAMTKVAQDAISLLVRCQTHQRPPRAEEVDPLREAWVRTESGL